jgi:hypothetical protein
VRLATGEHLRAARGGESVIPKAITRELEKLVRERDRYKRLAQDRAPVRSADRRREIEARDKAVHDLLFLVVIEGIEKLSRGGKGRVYDAVKGLRPDVAKAWDEEGADAAKARFYPQPEDLK